MIRNKGTFILCVGIILFSMTLIAGCCTNDNDGDGFYTDGGFCGELDCDDTDPSVGPCVCFWEITIQNDDEDDEIFTGNGAVHQFAGALLTSFFLTLNHFDEPNDGLGNVQVPGGGPDPGEIGSWGATFNFQHESQAWVAADGSDETSATLVITKNNTSELEGTVSGIAATVGSTGLMLKPFTLNFRSDHGVPGRAVCGDR